MEIININLLNQTILGSQYLKIKLDLIANTIPVIFISDINLEQCTMEGKGITKS